MPGPDNTTDLDLRISQAADFDPVKTQPLTPEPPAAGPETDTAQLQAELAGPLDPTAADLHIQSAAAAKPSVPDKTTQEIKVGIKPSEAAAPKNQVIETPASVGTKPLFPAFTRPLENAPSPHPTPPLFPQYGRLEAPSGIEPATHSQLLREIIRQYGDIFSPRFAEAEIPEDVLDQEKTALINQLSEMAKKYPSIRQMITIAGEVNFGGSFREAPLSARAVAGFALILDLVGADQFTALCLETRADLTDRRADLDEKLGKFAQWCSSNNVPFEPTPDLINALLDNSLRQFTPIPLHQAARDLLGIPQNYNAQLFVESDPANPISALRVSLETKWQPPNPTQVAAETTIKVLGILKDAINRFRPPSPPIAPSPA